ncbi:hypothetical protein GUJ93_ZPchr0003g16689 [Zizania palustris]|uniref:Uncharacterized protein n=1 Tax=Zizania palustris TaxID=103762 RepID=A0A8J5S641_ZIZPA|nr:hypothetical protein GUJ93_ZPchr0003g16689 [Zizania palustris]
MRTMARGWTAALGLAAGGAGLGGRRGGRGSAVLGAGLGGARGSAAGGVGLSDARGGARRPAARALVALGAKLGVQRCRAQGCSVDNGWRRGLGGGRDSRGSRVTA